MAQLDTAIAYWKGIDYAGAGNWLDGSGNGLHAVPQNAPVFNPAGYWEMTRASSQYFVVAHNALLDMALADSFSILCINALDAGAGAFDTHGMVGKIAGIGSLGYTMYLDMSQQKTYMLGGTGTVLYTGHNLNDGAPAKGVQVAWMLLRDRGTTTIRLGNDGTWHAAGQADGTNGSLATGSDLVIGRRTSGDDANYFDGNIWALAIWKAVLTDADFAAAALELLAVSPVAAQSTATVPNGAVGLPTTIVVQARDGAGNPLASGGAVVVVGVAGANVALPVVTDNADGTYTAAYTPANAGNDAVAITLNGLAISGSPYVSVVTGAGGGVLVSRASLALRLGL